MATITIKRLSVTTAASIFLSLLITGKAEAFTFTKIADDSGPFSFVDVFFGPEPVINNGGTVAFLTNLDTGGAGIFTGSGGATTTIAIANDRGRFGTFGMFDSPPALNDEGTVAFLAILNSGVPRSFFGGGLFTSNGGSTTFIADNNLRIVPFLGDPAINNEGTIAITALLPGESDRLFTVSGGATTLITDNSGPFSGFGSTAINDAGTVAFLASLDEGGNGIFTTSGGAITTIADSSGPFGFLLGTALNNAGTVAFSAFRDFQDFLEGGGGGGIFTSSGGVTTNIADNTGPFRTFGSGLPAINDAGTVAFLASLDEGGSGIFTGPNPVTDKVIATGDSLFGSTVTSLSFNRFSSKGLNNAGQLTFFAQLADGSSGIFRADPESTPEPQPVPEPASVLNLLAVGALGIGTWRKRQQWRTS
ncbi:MAG TPA: choice-of-anchor tandem repeat NxxGxxAF-containing protein [Leptolyngbyaceae cyanobacterium]